MWGNRKNDPPSIPEIGCAIDQVPIRQGGSAWGLRISKNVRECEKMKECLIFSILSEVQVRLDV